MKTLSALVLIILFLSCEEKQKSFEFSDKLLDFVLENRDGRYIELPDLYDGKIREIPLDNEERLILAEKLKTRGFKVTDSRRGNYPLSGFQIVTLILINPVCECEVSKIYYSTTNISEYKVSERIKCSYASQ